jgi:hypothetical protein
VVDRVDAENRVKRTVRERERLARIGAHKARPVGKAALASGVVRGLTPSSSISIPVTRQPVVATVNRAEPPEPLATSRTSLDESSSSQQQNRGCSSAVSHEFWPMSSPNASRRIDANSSWANRS